MSSIWYPDTNTSDVANNIGLTVQHGYLIRKPNPKGSFHCAIPIWQIFGFVDD